MNRMHIGQCRWICIFIGFVILPGAALGQTTFERTYGGGDADHGESVQQTRDGGYVIAGHTQSFYTSWDIYLVRTDILGDTLWSRTFGGSRHEMGYAVQETFDGGYIVIGETNSFGAGGLDAYLIKTDSLGDTIWTRTYGGSSDDNAYSVQQCLDGGYVIVGRIRGDIWLIKTDATGEAIWTNTYGGADDNYGRSVRQTVDGGYIIAGYTAFPASPSVTLLVKTDFFGQLMWDKTYGDYGSARGNSVWETPDGGYIVAGRRYADSSDVHLLRTDVFGNTVWTRTYGGSGSDDGCSVRPTLEGGYIVGGWTGSFGSGKYDVWLLKTDSLGDTLWTRTYGGSNWDLGKSVCQTQDGGYVIAGRASSFGAGDGDFYLIKTDENGLTGVEEADRGSAESRTSFQLLQNSPNPFRHSTTISYSLPQATQVTFAIYDITGRLVETLVNETEQPGMHLVRWDRSANSSGVYFYRLNAGDFIETRKMVVVE
jgi:hypothetical protein